MQYITSGNRIAVENFTVGYLYTIIFTNGDYIHSACTGIGMDFVMFTRTEPEYTFALTMETAADVSSIDLYSEGGGTTNYNELANKPQINSVELVGNKSLNDLGIQALITNDNKLSSTLVSGLGTAAASDASDFATSAEGALAATAVQPADLTAALSSKQDTIDNSHKLSADLVDDTTTTNKFATAAELQQIETNKTNILFNQSMGVKNIIKNTATSSGIFTVNSDGTIKAQGTNSGSSAIFVTVATISANEAYKLNGMILNGCPSGGESGGYRINLQLGGGSYNNYAIDRGDGVIISGIPQNPPHNLRLIAAVEAGKTVDIVFKPMISTIGGEYQPYAPSNRELYEMILALQ